MKRSTSRDALSVFGERGIALVIVLLAIVLLSGLTIAFFLSVSTDRSSAKSFAQGSDARKLADTALSVVFAQIKDATSSSGTAAWASQPGLIRTFGANGAQVDAYKLYSSSSLRGGPAFNPLTNTGSPADVPANWYTLPALYTDLNAPVYTPDVTGTVSIGGQLYSSNYPILDVSVLNLSGSAPKGFSIDQTNLPVNSGTANYDPVPMPVEWLYVLQDGEIVSGSAATGSTTTVILSGTAATKNNPIVGRIAFWTDDDTCKININTAAGDVWTDSTDPGTYSDMPYTSGTTVAGGIEYQMYFNQAVDHEYQRYPGHPATTYLSAVFPGLLNSRQMIYDIAPRVTYYKTGDTTKKDLTSQGGTVNTTSTSLAPLPLSDSDHLYASVDELQFVNLQSQLSGTARPVSVFTPQQVKQAQFFLTAQSRAPELNVFGKPRISMWPEIVDTTGTNLIGTVFDKTIAFCSTIGSGTSSKAYYFTRNDPTNQYFDYYGSSDPTSPGTAMQRNRDLYAYLQDLTSTPIPGFGGDFLSKYTVDRDQILTEMFDYVRGCINLFDVSDPANLHPYTGDAKNLNMRFPPSGTGEVIPIQIGSTRGFGRTYTPSAPVLHFVGLDTQIDPNALAAYAKTSGTTTTGVLAGPSQGSTSARLFTNKVQAVLLFNNFCPAMGTVRVVPNLIYEVIGLDKLQLNGQSLGFSGSCRTTFTGYAPNNEYQAGGICGPASLFYSYGAMFSGSVSALGMEPGNYQFYGNPITFPTNTVEFRQPLPLTGGENIMLNIYAMDNSGNQVPGGPIQTIKFHFPDTTIPCPGADGCAFHTYNTGSKGTDPTVQCVPNSYKSPPDPARTYFTVRGFDCLLAPANTYTGPVAPGFDYLNVGGESLYDVTRGLVPYHGDMRLVMASQTVDSDTTGAVVYQGGLGYSSPVLSGVSHYEDKYDASKNDESTSGGMVSGESGRDSNGNANGWFATTGSLVADVTYERHVNRADASYGPAVSTSIGPAQVALTGTDGGKYPGDWDTGMSGFPDGPYINKADEGDSGAGPYGSYSGTASSLTLFSPNKQVPSPAVFGSLSTGVKAAKPWQTLLFCPNPPAGNLHPGFASPADHLLLDFFTMPVVEPYAISEPFSTAGKINLNYQIAPFTYITRNTGLQAVLRSTRLIAIPTTDGLLYKYHGDTSNPSNKLPSGNYRLNLDIDTTLKGFDQRFASNRPFRSASEICTMFLVPQGDGITDPSQMPGWWASYALTGDNLREKPYSQIYSRLTTKSNSYTVHVRAQSLKKLGNDPNQGQWVENQDLVVGEYRGSFSIERYIDPNDSTLSAFDETYFGDPSYDSSGNIIKSGQLDPFYRFRVVSTKQFAP